MSVPPPPSQWGPQPPGGQPAGAPQWGPPQSGAPQWGPQQPWGPPPGPPPSGGGKGKWIFGGIALLAVIAVTVVITVMVVGKDSGGSPSPTSTSAPASDIASANDKGPVAVITEDPTCASATPILETRASQQRNGWDKRDPSIPAAAWTPEMRGQYRGRRRVDARFRRPNGAARQAHSSSGDARTLRADDRLFAGIRGQYPDLHPARRQACSRFNNGLECNWIYLFGDQLRLGTCAGSTGEIADSAGAGRSGRRSCRPSAFHDRTRTAVCADWLDGFYEVQR